MNGQISRWIDRIPTYPTLKLGGLAISVGLTCWFGVWFFMEVYKILFATAFSDVSCWMVALVPMIGGIIVGLIANYWIGEDKLNGTANIMQSVALAGVVLAPLTLSILLFEMTNIYRIILPLMFVVAVSMIISQQIEKDSVYSLGKARHGFRLDRSWDVEVLDSLTVGEVYVSDIIVELGAPIVEKKSKKSPFLERV